MPDSQSYSYDKIAEAIAYLHKHFRQQPDLETIARQVHWSPEHFQRRFAEWAGVSPKKFVQYLSLQYAKELLRKTPMSLFETAHHTGLSGTGRLHELFVKLEGMSPAEFRNGGKPLRINYQYYDTRFGRALVANTSKGVCFLQFEEAEENLFSELQQLYPNADLQESRNALQEEAIAALNHLGHGKQNIHLHLGGTAFQLKVWEALLSIPMGAISSYGALADSLGQPGSGRAVGTAIGNNPVAILIPCHRVIQSSGGLGGYRWGLQRKSMLLAWEAAQLHRNEKDAYL